MVVEETNIAFHTISPVFNLSALTMQFAGSVPLRIITFDRV